MTVMVTDGPTKPRLMNICQGFAFFGQVFENAAEVNSFP